MPRTWSKADLAEAVSEETKLTKKDAGVAVEAFLKAIEKALQNRDKVQLTGFGSFEVRTRAARKAKNLRTGEEIDVPEASVPAFKAGKSLKDAVK
jgi:DNA-binding protein HU-beta